MAHRSSSTAVSFYILTATDELKKATDCMQDSSCEEYRKISYIIEQLKLLQKQKHGRCVEKADRCA